MIGEMPASPITKYASKLGFADMIMAEKFVRKCKWSIIRRLYLAENRFMPARTSTGAAEYRRIIRYTATRDTAWPKQPAFQPASSEPKYQ